MLHYKKDGTLDMRYTSSKGAALGSTNTMLPEYEPAHGKVSVIDPKYRSLGQTKHGKQGEHTEACHILSHEVFSAVLSKATGYRFSDRVQEQIARELNSDANL